MTLGNEVQSTQELRMQTILARRRAPRRVAVMPGYSARACVARSPLWGARVVYRRLARIRHLMRAGRDGDQEMISLLADAIQAHGGLKRWKAHLSLAAAVMTGGDLWELKGVGQNQGPRTIRIDLHRQWASIEPFGKAGQRADFSPENIAIKAGEQEVVASRKCPRLSFAGHDMRTTWDSLHRVYFDGCMFWTFLTTPFLLAMNGFEICEIEPLREGTEVWRGLRASFPGAIASHSAQQDFYFGPDMLVRRHDYRIEIGGNVSLAQYLSDPVSVDGIKIPTKGRAYLHDKDLKPLVDVAMITIDVSDLRFS